MAEKISTLELKVDLGCRYCYKKIQKTLCKLQERENIKTISYDKKNNTITISGPFDPEKLIKKLRCMACKVIIIIIIVKPPPTPTPTKPPPEPCKCCCKVCNNIKIISCDHHKDPKCTVTKKVIEDPTPEKKKDDKDKKPTEKETKKKVINDIEIIICEHPKCPDPCPPPCPPPCEPPCPPPCPPPCEPPCPPPCPPPCQPPCPPPCPPPCEPWCPPPCQPPICQVCCRMPSSGGHQGGSRCYSCGRIEGCVPDCPPMPFGGTSHGGYQFMLKEDPSPSCAIM
ncbi:protein PYRICULARIA ORYZAE RESISTANCE 21-like [Phoenix dactylifera]|uniref:Protein PYRICULARIA ORYZAE RESISTANCE 21-like n=1 Tax=Phoenix dactylifera TaxID=42345 RepID=A0A8B9AA46_PHODC|nr:protein PYRICULARIA ORYZAE RESISTANCE 21-like [Phoenix dactylifera]